VPTIRIGEFEWDEAKAASNARKHGVSFEEAMTVFLDELAVPFEEPMHPERLILLGESQLGRVLLVVFAERGIGGRIRIISARRATNASGQPMPKTTEPSKRSLREIPEIVFATAKRLRRGKYAEKARRSFAVVIVEPALFARFGSSEAVNAALRAVVEAADNVKRPVKSRKRARSKDAA
jgi:uncharacterized DUF497 family protein